MTKLLTILFVLLLAWPLVAQKVPDAPQPSLKHDLLFVTEVNSFHLAGLALDAQSTNADVNFSKCCYEEHDFLYGRYPTLGRLSGVMAVEYGMNEAYSLFMWRHTVGMPKWKRYAAAFGPGITMGVLHLWAGTHNQVICRQLTPEKCSLFQRSR